MDTQNFWPETILRLIWVSNVLQFNKRLFLLKFILYFYLLSTPAIWMDHGVHFIYPMGSKALLEGECKRLCEWRALHIRHRWNGTRYSEKNQNIAFGMRGRDEKLHFIIPTAKYFCSQLKTNDQEEQIGGDVWGFIFPII